jgi:hypothetical protein
MIENIETQNSLQNRAVSSIDYTSVVNELSLQVANYARENAILKSVIKSLQEQVIDLQSKQQ